MLLKYKLFALLISFSAVGVIECRSYNNGLVFYDLETNRPYLPPTVSVSRGRKLASANYSSQGSIWSTFGKPCDCIANICSCCAGLNVKQFDFNQKMCANVTYASAKKEALLEVYLNGKPSSKYGISARNPSPFCIPVMMAVPMAMCVQMSNIAVQGNNLNMCMDFVLRLATTDFFEMHFQCMRMGLDGIQYLDKNGQPVIPPSSKNDLGDGEYTEEADDKDAEYENGTENESGSSEYTQIENTQALDEDIKINEISDSAELHKPQYQTADIAYNQLQSSTEAAISDGAIDKVYEIMEAISTSTSPATEGNEGAYATPNAGSASNPSVMDNESGYMALSSSGDMASDANVDDTAPASDINTEISNEAEPHDLQDVHSNGHTNQASSSTGDLAAPTDEAAGSVVLSSDLPESAAKDVTTEALGDEIIAYY